MECIGSILAANSACEVEILLCDNGIQAGPGTLPDRVRVTAHGTNLGFGAGHNINLAQSRFDHFLILNPDTTVPDGAIDALVAGLDEGDFVAVAPLLVDAHGVPHRSLRRLPTLATEFGRLFGLDRRVDSVFSTLVSPPLDRGAVIVQQPPGAALLLSTATLRELGGFDESFAMYFEDVELCRQLASRGSLGVLPGVRVSHDGEGTARSFRAATTFWIEYSRRRYHSRTTHGLRRWALLVILTSSVAARAAIFSMVAGTSSERAERARGYRLALWSVVHGTDAYWRERMLTP